MDEPGRRFDHASLVTARGHGACQRLDALWLALSSLYRACSFQHSPTLAVPHLQCRHITLHRSLALADAGAAAASTGVSWPKCHSARVRLSTSSTASCASPRAWASYCVDAECLPPRLGASRRRSPRVQRAPAATCPPLALAIYSAPLLDF